MEREEVIGNLRGTSFSYPACPIDLTSITEVDFGRFKRAAIKKIYQLDREHKRHFVYLTPEQIEIVYGYYISSENLRERVDFLQVIKILGYMVVCKI